MITSATTLDPYTPCRWRAGVDLDQVELPRHVVALARYLPGIIATPAKVASTLQELLRDDQDWEVKLSEAGMIGLRLGDQGWPLLLFEPIANAKGIQVCRV